MTRRDRWAFAAVACAIAVAMGASILNGFVYDDVPIIVQNARVTDPSHWPEILRFTYWPGSLWRPLVLAGYALQWQAGGGAPWLFHLVSLALYLLLGWCAFRLLEEAGASFAAALIAVLWFVVHPVHVEVVANVVGQAELITATALVLAAWGYLRTRRLGITMPRLLAILLAIAVATMAKEQGFVAPLVLIGAEWLLVPRREESRAERFRLLLPTTAFTVLMLVIRSTVTGTLKGEFTAASLLHLGFRDRLVTFLAVVPEYARLLVWPVHLQAEYSPPELPVAGPITVRHLLGIALIAAIVLLFVRSRRRQPLVAFGLWWAAVAIGPVSHLVSAAGIVMAERVFFQPSLGFAFALAGGLTALDATPHRRWQRAVLLFLAVWCLGGAVRSAVRVPVWRTQEGFFTAMPKDGPRDYRAALVSGLYWRSVNNNAAAELELRRALMLWPHDARSNETLGQLLREAGRCGEAAPILRQGLTVDPGRTAVRAKLIECLLVTGDTTSALTEANAGIALGDSSFVSTRRRLARP